MESSVPNIRKSIYPCSAPSDPDRLIWRVHVLEYSTSWPIEFLAIARHLAKLFETSDPAASYTCIEHIGSTAVPGLCAKPNIDVLVTFSNAQQLTHATEALLWEIPGPATGYARYTRVPRGGGIQGRESFKLYIHEPRSAYFNQLIERSVYLINEDASANPAGPVQIRCYRSLRDVLRQPENSDLFAEYAELKWKLAQETFPSSLTYSAKKDQVIRKILRRAGWTDEEVDLKEHLSERVDWPEDDQQDAY